MAALFKSDCFISLVYLIREIIEREWMYIIVKAHVPCHFVGICGNLIGEFSNRVAVFFLDKKIDKLKYNS